MKRAAVLLLLVAAGCSTAPLANFLDFVHPGRLRDEGAQPYGGVCVPHPVGAVVPPPGTPGAIPQPPPVSVAPPPPNLPPQ